jgi:hypothetical protein
MPFEDLFSRQTQRATVVSAIVALGAASFATQAIASGSHQNVHISTRPTWHMTFKHGVYSPTREQAVLNVNDLENALAAGNVEVTTGNGSDGTDKGNLHVEAAVTWVSGSRLTLDAYRSIIVSQSVVDAGTGGLVLATNDGGSGGTYRYGPGGNISIWNPSGALAVDGQPYTLVGDIKTLANDIKHNASGHYALTNSYDAGADGTYSQSPVATVFQGSFDALGNAISNLKTTNGVGGLFNEIGSSGAVRNLRLTSVDVDASHGAGWIGALANQNQGVLSDDSVDGVLTGSGRSTNGPVAGLSTGTVMNCSSATTVTTGDTGGGLVGENEGLISDSSSTGAVTLENHRHAGVAGGLVGLDFSGTISGSFATGAVSATMNEEIGGLVGVLPSDGNATIVNSYATGAVTGGENGSVGGLIGVSYQGGRNIVSASYATGPITPGQKDTAGGVIGWDDVPGGCGCFAVTYWDMTTSGITNPDQGAGNVPDEPGVTGLTTAQLQAALPTGFDRRIWNENPSINNGLPYLIANPPPNN